MLNFFGVKGVRGVKGVKAKCHAAGRVSAFNSWSGAITPFNSFNSNKLKLAKVELLIFSYFSNHPLPLHYFPSQLQV